MLLRHMRSFAAVVDCGSFTEAAEQSYLSQSAISQQIQALERELGVELIRRENRRFSLTVAGEYFYARCKAVLEEVDELERETKRLGSGRHAPRLRIGCLRCYSGLELRRAVARFAGRYPEVEISIVHGTHEELYELLRDGGVELILSDQRRAFSESYVNFELMRCGCYAEVSARSPLSRGDSVSLDDLKRMPCILIAPREQADAERAYYQNTLGFGSSYLFADHLEEGRLLAAGNRGFLPVDGLGTLPPEGEGLRRIPICQDGRQLLRNYCAFWRRDRSEEYIEAFAQILRALLQKDSA